MYHLTITTLSNIQPKCVPFRDAHMNTLANDSERRYSNMSKARNSAKYIT